MSRYLPKSKPHRTLAARMCRAIAHDLRHVVDGLEQAAQQYEHGEIETACCAFYLSLEARMRYGSQAFSELRTHDDTRAVLTRAGFLKL